MYQKSKTKIQEKVWKLKKWQIMKIISKIKN